MKTTNVNPAVTENVNPSIPNRGTEGRFSAPAFPTFKFPRETSRHYTPWLVVRDADGDAGARPLPANTVFWESPDVWVQSTRGINRPVPGQPNQVFARVTNLGWQYATGVMVKFWWVDPTLAVTESNAHLIGVGWTNIPSGWSVVVECPTPWVPIVVNGGHECLFAEAFIPHFDPLTAPMDPMDDRHVGQKNEQLVLGRAGTSFKVRVNAINVAALRQTLTVEVQPLHLTTIPPLLALRAQALPARLRPPSATLPVTITASTAPKAFIKPSNVFTRRLSATPTHAPTAAAVAPAAATRLALVQPASSLPVQVRHVAEFDAWESRVLEIDGTIPRTAEEGQTFAFRIVQHIGQVVTGGYTVNVVVTKS